MMLKKRPKNLNLLSISFPVPAIVSILHRVSGIVLFLLFPVVLWVFNYSLWSESNFLFLQKSLSSPWVRVMIWLFITPLCYHFVAGIRHLFMDCHVGETKRGGKRSAKIALVLAVIIISLVGVWLW